MTSVQDTYLGWNVLAHAQDRRRPQWVVDVRTDADVFRGRREGPAHSCPSAYDTCGHGERYERSTLRMVCRACGTAHILAGELHHVECTTTARLGYGQAPRKVSGLWLWPGDPWLSFGRMSSDEPHDFLVTRPGVARVADADVVGQIMQGRGKRGGVVWTAAVVPAAGSEYGKYGVGRIRFEAVSEGLRSVPAAAKWIAAHPVGSGEGA